MTARRALVAAVVVVEVVRHLVPYGDRILYPLTLFTTWVHELGHGLTALAAGGHFAKLEIFADASGEASAYAQGRWGSAAVFAGGLLAPTLLGALILAFAHGPARARAVLLGLAAALAASAAIWVRSPVGLVAVPALAALLGWCGWRGLGPEGPVFLVQLLAVILALDTVERMIPYVFSAGHEARGSYHKSDVFMIAERLGGHYFVWGALLTLIACALLALGLWRAWGANRPATSKHPI
jgi:hypothetical protein